jgi:hypothetical protein
MLDSSEYNDPELLKFLGGLTVSLDPLQRFRSALGEPRSFQAELLTSTSSRVIAMASRQLGKSTAVACLTWDAFLRGLTVVVITPTEKQAKEFLLRVKEFRDADPFAPTGIAFLKTEVTATNHKGRPRQKVREVSRRTCWCSTRLHKSRTTRLRLCCRCARN